MSDSIDPLLLVSAPQRAFTDHPPIQPPVESREAETPLETHNIPSHRLHQAAQALGITTSDLCRRLGVPLPPCSPTQQTASGNPALERFDSRENDSYNPFIIATQWSTPTEIPDPTIGGDSGDVNLVASGQGIVLPLSLSSPLNATTSCIPTETSTNSTTQRSLLRDQWASPLPHIFEDLSSEPTTETLGGTPFSAVQGSGDNATSDSGTLSASRTNSSGTVDFSEGGQYHASSPDQVSLPRQSDASQQITTVSLVDLSMRQRSPTLVVPGSKHAVEPEREESQQDGKELRATTEQERGPYRESRNVPGPSKVWKVPRRTRQRKRRVKADQPVNASSSTDEVKHLREQRSNKKRRHRGAFTNDVLREMTAQTRELNACIRCRMQRNRCRFDPANPGGPCLTCLEMSNRTISKLPCLRLIITDATIYREQLAPYQGFSKRWQNMDIVDIQDWASDQVKTIYISQAFLDAPYPVEVREFIPREGDLVEEKWITDGKERTHRVPEYALANMEKHAEDLQAFIDKNVGTYIVGAIGTADEFLWKTFCMAFRQVKEAETAQERRLLENLFRLWVAIYKTSNVHHIYGDDKLGADLVSDSESPWFNLVPMPAVIIAQKECIIYTKIFRPLSKKILRDLQDLVTSKKRQYWLTIYLTLFILMHSCSMITRRDEETARQYGLRERFANPYGITSHHIAAQTMLAHFNYINAGFRPFQLALEPSGKEELMQAGQLTEEKVEFVRGTALWVKSNEALLRRIQEENDSGHPYYWISQIYQETWTPGPIG